MSGQAHAGIGSDKYRFTVSGGISTWDYRRVDEDGNAIEQALAACKDELDRLFAEATATIEPSLVRFGEDGAGNSIYGMLEELDQQAEAIAAANANQRDTSLHYGADVSARFPGTSFQATLQVRLSDRVPRATLEDALAKMIECAQRVPALAAALY